MSRTPAISRMLQAKEEARVRDRTVRKRDRPQRRTSASTGSARRYRLYASRFWRREGRLQKCALASPLDLVLPGRNNHSLVEPQAMSFRTTYSCSGTFASAATLRSGKTVCEVVAYRWFAFDLIAIPALINGRWFSSCLSTIPGWTLCPTSVLDMGGAFSRRRRG